MLKNNSEHFLSPRAASEVQHMPPADDPSKKMCSSIFGWNSPEALLSTECDGVSKLLCKKKSCTITYNTRCYEPKCFSDGCTRSIYCTYSMPESSQQTPRVLQILLRIEINVEACPGRDEVHTWCYLCVIEGETEE